MLAVVLLHHPLGATNLDFRRELSEYLEEGMQYAVSPATRKSTVTEKEAT